MVEHSADSNHKVPEVAYRRIASGLRDQILNGKFAPGEQLPSQGKLAAVWHSNAFTIHMAIKTLVKEGWAHSIRGGGVYVTQHKNRFVCAGVLGATFSTENESPFFHRLHVALLEQFRRLKKETLVFADTRPMSKQGPVLPALAEAIRTRRIQCLVFPMAHDVNVPALSRLALPTATMAKAATNRVDFDQESLLRDGVRRLARQGCRSIGLVTNIGKPDPVYSIFRKAIRDEGLRTRGRWIRSPSHSVSEPSLSRYGYTEFKSVWELRDKPDGLIVYPDAMVNGVIMAVLEAGRSLVTEQMKFLFHRNSKISVFCPFPVTWAISDEEALAEGLIDMIYRQFAGEKITPVFLPYVFHDDAEARSKHR